MIDAIRKFAYRLIPELSSPNVERRGGYQFIRNTMSYGQKALEIELVPAEIANWIPYERYPNRLGQPGVTCKIDSLTAPSYFVKSTDFGLVANDPSELVQRVTQEIEISKQISDFFRESQSFQKLLQHFHVDRFEVVSPMLGIVGDEKGVLMMYPFIASNSKPTDYPHLLGLIANLKSDLFNLGIDAIDLSLQNLLIFKENDSFSLYLTDLEYFSKVKPTNPVRS